MHTSSAHIAGLGLSERSDASLEELTVSAATKALLDAGITYSDVDLNIAGFLDDHARIARSWLNVFGSEGAPVLEVDNHSALFVGTQCITSRQNNCALVVGVDQAASSASEQSQTVAVAFLLVSDLFLTSHAYLKDGSVRVQGCSLMNTTPHEPSGNPNGQHSVKSVVQRALRQAQLQPKDVQMVVAQPSFNQSAQLALSDFGATQPPSLPDSPSSLLVGTTGLAGLCELVWQLRGWSQGAAPTQVQNSLQCTISPNGAARVVLLCRSDGKAAQKWANIRDIRDGRERLGYNPAVEKRGIAREDLEAVRSRKARASESSESRLQLSIKGGDRAALARL